jgi:hypothetical protein
MNPTKKGSSFYIKKCEKWFLFLIFEMTDKRNASLFLLPSVEG